MGGCETLGLGGGPSADELRLTAEDMRTEARSLANAGQDDAASAMGSAADVADAAADASEGDFTDLLETVVDVIPMPTPYKVLALAALSIGSMFLTRRRGKALKVSEKESEDAWTSANDASARARKSKNALRQVVTGIQASGGPTEDQRKTLSGATSTETKAAIDDIVGNIGNA